MAENKSTGWSKAAQRRAGRRYAGSQRLTPAAPEDRGRDHEAEQEARKDEK